MFKRYDVMNPSSRLACLAGLLVFPMLGCSDLGGGQEGAGGTGGTAGDAGDGDASVPLLPVTMFVLTVEVTPQGTTAVLEGVEICQLDTDNCVTSNANGRAELELPANSEVAWTIEKEGYGSYLTVDITDDTYGGRSTEPMYTHQQLEELAAQLGISYPWTGGIFGLATLPGMAGLTFDLLGESATPFYSDETGTYSYDIEETTGLGGFPAPFGMGGFAELSPGEYEAEFHGTGDRCSELSFGWPGGGPNRVRTPVRAGYISHGSLRCGGP